ncbi:MAG TPA: class I SAM-dependent methyltransferase, partial [Candidatus Bathyarchaeota archaeon]|nr:class I SAM-dependent methyltransferase [Candidatus Bathyarchaeota archaeon]
MEQWKVKRELMKTFNDIAYAFDATRRREWSEVHLFICKSGLTADFGCGSGRNLLPILIFNREVLAIDISVEMLKIFLKKALKIHKYFFANAVLCDLN